MGDSNRGGRDGHPLAALSGSHFNTSGYAGGYLFDFALEIADELSNEYPNEFQFDYRDKASALAPNDAAEVILKEIVTRLGDRFILLIMENLDRAFQGLGDLGQKKWRAFLQEHSCVATLTTSQQLFEDVSSRNAAFYGFFDIFHLDPLSVDDATELMTKISVEHQKDDLVQFIGTPEGRHRIRALHHLAGGNHRMYILFSEFLTKDSLDGLIASFEQLAEDMTPYFQERVNSLPPQQARIVQSLCNARGAMTVKAVAQDTFIPERNVSKQLGNLKLRRFVISQKRGKESFYDMAEPLMRLCLEVKKQRGKPLKLVAAFLRAWFSNESLKQEMEKQTGQSANQDRCLAYLKVAMQEDSSLQQILLQNLKREVQRNMDHNQIENALKAAEELSYIDEPSGLLLTATIFAKNGQSQEALRIIDDVLTLQNLADNQKADALAIRGFTYGQLSDTEKAIDNYSEVLRTKEFSVKKKAEALLYRGALYADTRQFEQAADDLSCVAKMSGVSSGTRIKSLFCLPGVLIPIKPIDESIASIENAFKNGDSAIDSFGWMPGIIINMVLLREHRVWAEFIEKLISVYAKFGALDLLGSGLAESISSLDGDEYSKVQLDLWNASWQKFGSEHDALSIPLSVLDAAVRVIKTGNDKPLFDLPLEIRKIVRPLLNRTLGVS